MSRLWLCLNWWWGLVRWFSGWRSLLPSLATWVPSLGPHSWRWELTLKNCPLTSACVSFHMCAYTRTKKTNRSVANISKKIKTDKPMSRVGSSPGLWNCMFSVAQLRLLHSPMLCELLSHSQWALKHSLHAPPACTPLSTVGQQTVESSPCSSKLSEAQFTHSIMGMEQELLLLIREFSWKAYHTWGQAHTW